MTLDPGIELLGRVPEKHEIEARLARAHERVGGLVLVTGDAGIGKSALLEYAAIMARRSGFDVAWSACWQTAVVPALLPWTQVVSQLSHDGAAVPELLVDITGHDAARFEQARRVETWLRRRAGSPALIVLDDLHWADAATLSVLGHIAKTLAGMAVLVIGAFRPMGSTTSPRVAAIEDLARHAVVLELGGLDLRTTGELIVTTTGQPTSLRTARSVFEITGGNPLFTRELSRTLLSTGEDSLTIDPYDFDVPSSVQAIVTDRLTALPRPCRVLVEVLSAAGDEAPVELLCAAARMEPESVLVSVDEGRRAGLLTSRPGAVAFAHAVFRMAVYESLSSALKAELHDRLGTELLRQRGRGVAVQSAALAHHFGRATPLGNAERAFRYSIEAAREAAAMGSFDLAVRRFSQALAILNTAPVLGSRVALLLDLADAQIATGDEDRARATFAQAADLARTEGDAPALGRAALGLSGGLGGIEVRLGDDEVCDLLEEASERLDDDDVIGPRVLARLSIALSYRAPSSHRVEIASRARHRAMEGGDSSTIAEALAAWCDVAAGPDKLAERLALAAEIVRHTRGSDPRAEALGRRLLIEALLESGDLQQADIEITRFARTASRLGRSEYGWYPALWRGAIALARLQPDVWLRAHARLRAQIPEAAGTNAGLLAAVQVVSMAFDLADPKLSRSAFDEINSGSMVIDDSQVGVSTALVLALAGHLGGAGTLVDRFAPVAVRAEPDSEWPAMMMQLTEVIVALGGHDAARDVRAAIEPYGAVWAIEGIGAGIRGPLNRALGLLASVEGDRAGAETHFAAAHEAAVRAGATLIATLVDHDAGRALDDHERLARAGATWQAIGATHRLAQIEDHNARPTGLRTGTRPIGANRFARAGEVWTIEYEGVGCTLTHRKGLLDIARLLTNPGREIAALDLVAPGPTLHQADMGEIIDGRARGAYRVRLAELDIELDEADAHHDIERSTRLIAERDALIDQLAGAFGLGGRARRTGGSAERARTAVRSRIRDALRRIEAVHYPLHRHLTRSIRTGTYCVYDPEPGTCWLVDDGSHTV